jgi:hypothetical protein
MPDKAGDETMIVKTFEGDGKNKAAKKYISEIKRDCKKQNIGIANISQYVFTVQDQLRVDVLLRDCTNENCLKV